jgi:RimJ/RimL family protein N-acetyltransferase
MYLNGASSSRLSIRALELSDIPIWETFFENNPSLPYLGLNLNLNKKDQSTAWIKRQLERYDTGLYGHHALIHKESKEFIGQCGLLTQEIEGKKELEVGYHILPKFWGKGYATEAAIKFRDFAFENKLNDSLISVIDIRNKASQNVARKLGMLRGEQIRCFDLDVFIFRIYLNLS